MSRARERGWRRAVTTIFCALVLVVSTAGRSRAQAQPSSPKLVLHVGHASEITALEFARSKRQIEAGSAEGVVKLWDVGSGLEMQSFQAHKGTVRGLCMFPGDRRLASLGADGMVRVWDLQTTRAIETLQTGEAGWRLALTNDGKWLAAATTSGKITVWETQHYRPVLRLQDAEQLLHLAFTDNNHLRATNSLYYDPKQPHADVIWEVPSGRVVSEQRKVLPIAVNQRGQLVSLETNFDDKPRATVSDAEGRRISSWQYPVEQEDIADADLSPDGETLVTASMDMSGNAHEFTFVRLLDAHTGAVRCTIAGRDETAAMYLLAKFSPDGTMVAVAAENDISFFASATGQRLGQISWAGRPNTIRFSPGGHWLAVVVRRMLKVWDLETGALALSLGPVSAAAGVSFSPDDRYVASWNFDPKTLNHRSVDKRYQVKIWDLQDGGEVHTAPSEGPLNDVQFRPDGKQLAYSIGPFVMLCDPATGEVTHTLQEDLDYMSGHWLSYSRDGSQLLDFSDEHDIHVWDTHDGKLLSKLKESRSDESLSLPAVRSDSREDHLFVYSEFDKGLLHVWTPQSKAMATVRTTNQMLDVMAIDEHDGIVAVGSSSDRKVTFHDLPSLRERSSLNLPISAASMAFSPDGKWLAIGMGNGATALYEAATLELHATLVAMGSTLDWMVVTPNGTFDGSQRGLHTLMAWQFGDQEFPMDRFYRDFHVPQLLTRILGGERPAPALSLEALGFPPTAEIIAHSTVGDEASVRVRAAGRGDTVREIRLYLNHKLTAVRTVHGDSKAEATLRLALAHGENRIDVTALNSHGVESNEDTLLIQRSEARQKPILHILSVGISHYADPSLNLEYPEADGEALAQSFRRAAGGSFSQVDVVSLADAAASADRIRSALQRLQKRASADDVVIVYFAGHGVSLTGQYYFLTYAATQNQLASDIQPNAAISSEELASLLQALPSVRQFLILDTCQAGAALSAVAKPRSSPAPEGALSATSGIHLLAATSATQRERELAGLGHSVLAESLLEGLGASDHPRAANSEGVISVESLIAYAQVRNAQLARQHHGPATDLVIAGGSFDFPIASPPDLSSMTRSSSH